MGSKTISNKHFSKAYRHIDVKWVAKLAATNILVKYITYDVKWVAKLSATNILVKA